jgi:large subunit ribosomal protein L9
MNVILLERIEKLGQMGDLVTVKSGYGRNFLLPKGKAVFASKENIKNFAEQKVQLEGENISKKNEASTLAKNIVLKEVVIIRAASEAGQLYGSVSAKDIAQSITDAGLTIEKSQVILNKSLKSLSYEDISIKLHPEVSINIKLNIARSNEESKEQNKLGRPIISTETGGGDIRSERAQKDAKRFDKKEDKVIDKNIATTPEIKINENQDNNEANVEKENKDISEVTN